MSEITQVLLEGFAHRCQEMLLSMHVSLPVSGMRCNGNLVISKRPRGPRSALCCWVRFARWRDTSSLWK